MTIEIETIKERPSAVLFSGGRAFYGVNNQILYSQITNKTNEYAIAECFQVNDPTSPDFSDILATDGGVINLGESSRIIKLVENTTGIVALCENGVWLVSSSDAVFNATGFTVKQVSNFGCVSNKSVVQVGDDIYYWSYGAIYVLRRNQFGLLAAADITEDTIESFYNKIPLDSKRRCNGFYNKLKYQIEWFYRSDELPETDASNSALQIAYTNNNALFYNVKTGGFFPQDFNFPLTHSSSNPSGSEFITGGLDISNTTLSEPLYIGGQIDITELPGDEFIKSITPLLSKRDQTTFINFEEDGIQGSGIPCLAGHLETGFESLGKPSNTKEAPYITVHFKSTERNWIDAPIGSTRLILDKPSSCLLQSKWDWTNSSTENRWGKQQEAYRYRRMRLPSGEEPFDSGIEVVTTKNKVLGRGKSLLLRFEQGVNVSTGDDARIDQPDCQLLGYTTQWVVKARM